MTSLTLHSLLNFSALRQRRRGSTMIDRQSDVFVVRRRSERPRNAADVSSVTTVILPNGTRGRIMDRTLFEKAVFVASKKRRERKRNLTDTDVE